MKWLPEALEFLTRRKQAYVKTFGIPGTEGHVALTDLAKFCCAFDTDVPMEHDARLIMMGRRDAFWRVFNHLKLDPVELAVVYKAVVVEGG